MNTQADDAGSALHTVHVVIMIIPELCLGMFDTILPYHATVQNIVMFAQVSSIIGTKSKAVENSSAL